MTEAPVRSVSPEGEPTGSRCPCLSLIVAVSDNGVIGSAGDLPWRLSADLKRFRRLTTGHSIIMGRKTWESIRRLLPGRTTIIVTRDAGYRVEGAFMADSLERALVLAGEDRQPFIIGGGQIYRLAFPLAQRLYLTRVHATFDGDTRLPAIDWDQWQRIETRRHSADARNEHDYSFEVYRRRFPAGDDAEPEATATGQE